MTSLLFLFLYLLVLWILFINKNLKEAPSWLLDVSFNVWWHSLSQQDVVSSVVVFVCIFALHDSFTYFYWFVLMISKCVVFILDWNGKTNNFHSFCRLMTAMSSLCNLTLTEMTANTCHQKLIGLSAIFTHFIGTYNIKHLSCLSCFSPSMCWSSVARIGYSWWIVEG